jgi:hypothetical protein
MTEEAGGGARLGWGGALALAGIIILLGHVLNPLPLVLLPLGLLLVGLPPRRVPRLLLGTALWLLGAMLAAGPLGLVPMLWITAVALGYLWLTRLRPEWSAVHRMLASLAAAAALFGMGVAAAGQWGAFDGAVLAHFERVMALTLEQLGPHLPATVSAEQWEQALPRVTRAQWEVYPAVVGLQTLAALALAWWAFGRMRGSAEHWRSLGSLREFRFNDQLIWLLIAGLVLLLLPVHGVVDRIGWNALIFMGSLYLLRGAAVLLFWAAGVPTAMTLLLAALLIVFRLVPFLLTVALVVGVGDTWLDVRARTAAARRA